MEMNVRRCPTAARLTPVVLDPHERARAFPPSGHIGPEPNQGGGDP